MDSKDYEILCPAQFSVSELQHPEDVREMAAHAVHHIWMRRSRHHPVHGRDDSQNAHTRHPEGRNAVSARPLVPV